MSKFCRSTLARLTYNTLISDGRGEAYFPLSYPQLGEISEPFQTQRFQYDQIPTTAKLPTEFARGRFHVAHMVHTAPFSPVKL